MTIDSRSRLPPALPRIETRTQHDNGTPPTRPVERQPDRQEPSSTREPPPPGVTRDARERQAQEGEARREQLLPPTTRSLAPAPRAGLRPAPPPALDVPAVMAAMSPSESAAVQAIARNLQSLRVDTAVTQPAPPVAAEEADPEATLAAMRGMSLQERQAALRHFSDALDAASTADTGTPADAAPETSPDAGPADPAPSPPVDVRATMQTMTGSEQEAVLSVLMNLMNAVLPGEGGTIPPLSGDALDAALRNMSPEEKAATQELLKSMRDALSPILTIPSGPPGAATTEPSASTVPSADQAARSEAERAAVARSGDLSHMTPDGRQDLYRGLLATLDAGNMPDDMRETILRMAREMLRLDDEGKALPATAEPVEPGATDLPDPLAPLPDGSQRT